jgi:hypothetical protein
MEIARNILAHVFMDAAYGRLGRRSLSCVCEQILDRHGDRVVFPIMRERH